jgi:hypothetical protein
VVHGRLRTADRVGAQFAAGKCGQTWRAGVMVGSTATEGRMGTTSASTAGSPTSVAQILADARARLEQLSPEQAQAAMEAGALLVDIRSDSQRARRPDPRRALRSAQRARVEAGPGLSTP